MKHFRLTSIRSGKSHLVAAPLVDEFYFNEILGQSKKLIDQALAKVRNRTAFILEPFKLSGFVLLKLLRAGELIDVRAGANLIVTNGINATVDRLQSAAVAVHDYQAIGTGTTAPAAGNTTLETEIGTRVQGTLSQPTAATDRLVSTFNAGNGTGAITETGRLNASSGGNLFCRQTFAVINKGAGDSLQTTHDVGVS